MTIGVAISRSQRNLIGQRHSYICALQRIRIRVVYTLAISVELVGEGVVVEASAGTCEGCVTVGSSEISSVSAETEFWDWSAAGARPDLYDAGHGIGAIESALGSADKFETIGLLQGESAEIECAAGLVDGDAVDDHFVVSGVAAADEERRYSAALTGSIHYCARQETHCVIGCYWVHHFELATAQGG